VCTPGASSVIDGSRVSGRAAIGTRFFERWQNSSDALSLSHQFLTPDLSPSAQYFVAVIISHRVTQHWFADDRALLNQICDQLFEGAFSETAEMPLLSDQSLHIVGTIAFHDWPESWTEFLSRVMMIFDSCGGRARAKTCYVLAKFIHEVNSSLHITFSRRSEIVAAFFEAVPTTSRQCIWNLRPLLLS
jgi:hypothetical protein